MGCLNSAPRVVSKAGNDASSQLALSRLRLSSYMQTGSRVDKQYNKEHLLFSNILNSIISGVDTIRCPSGMRPPLCLSSQSFPLLLSNLELNPSETVDISLPVLSISSNNNCKIACLSQIQFLSTFCFEYENTQLLIHNIIQWLNNDKLLTKPILLYGFPDRYISEICKSLESLKVLYIDGVKKRHISHKSSKISLNKSENNDELNFISTDNHEIIFCSTSSNVSHPTIKEKFKEFLRNGGSLFFLYTPDYPNLANDFLLDFGIGYSNCKLSTNGRSKISKEVQNSIDDLLPCHFLSYSRLYCEYIKFPKINPCDLDDIITALRYHINVCNEKYYDTIYDIAKASWDLLLSTNFETENEIGSELYQSLIIVLIDEINQKTPPSKIIPVPCYKKFPGSYKQGEKDDSSEKVEVSNFNLEIVLHDESWISTGLYLPPGVTGVIKCSDRPRNMHVQIGSHTENLILKHSPWKRWPNIVRSFDILEDETKVGSCFGGIVYIYTFQNEEEEEEENEENEKDVFLKVSPRIKSARSPITVRMSFDNFTHYLRMVFENDSVYEKTKISGAPWGELNSKLLIITMPSDQMKNIENVDDLCTSLDKIISMTISYIFYKMVRPYRLVFDVEVLSDVNITCGYPIVLQLDLLKDIIFNYKKPTLGLFTLVKSIVIVSLPADYFDPSTEEAIGCIVATIIFKMNWPKFTISMLSELVNIPPLFNELRTIHTRLGTNIIPTILQESQSPDADIYNSPEEMWIAFVKKICQIAKYDLTPLLEKARPIPLSLIESVSQLPKCPERILKP